MFPVFNLRHATPPGFQYTYVLPINSRCWLCSNIHPSPQANHIRRCISHTPRAAVFHARLLDNQEGAYTERYVFRKLSARCFSTPTFLPPAIFQLLWRDIEHGKSAQGGVVYITVVCGIYLSVTTR